MDSSNKARQDENVEEERPALSSLQSHLNGVDDPPDSSTTMALEKLSPDDEKALPAYIPKQALDGQDSDKTRRIKSLELQMSRVYRELDLFMKTKRLGDVDDYSENEGSIVKENDQLSLPESKASLIPKASETTHQQKESQSSEQLESLENASRPSFKAEVYKYFKHYHKEGWYPDLQTTLSEVVPIAVEVVGEVVTESHSTFEVIKMFATTKTPPNLMERLAGKDSRLKVHTHLQTQITIRSTAIISAIRDVVDYYPMISYRYHSPLVMIQPFCLLLHYKDELIEYRDSRIRRLSVDYLRKNFHPRKKLTWCLI